ncbi:MAG: hypothetical protein ACREOU_10235 [Candidatus Eiseniibacteriota bacterium]
MNRSRFTPPRAAIPRPAKFALATLALTTLTLAASGCDRQSTTPTVTGLALQADRKSPAPAGEGCGDLPTAPESERVDLYAPVFSNPTAVTNPLFPIATLERVLLLGTEEGAPLRVETTLLARTETFHLNGQRFEALASQYVAWVDRRIHEVAIDWYVQDDQGAAWYLGEDVFNYEDGRLADREGTWRAGRDGPAAMIMPALPRVGDVWRPENICGLVFEEVIATTTDVVVTGPRGSVSGALIVRELHMDGSLEDKTFAPGYGEFSTGSGSNLEAVALAIPTDAIPGPVPDALETVSEGAKEIFEAVGAGEWDEASKTLAELVGGWNAHRSGGVPPMLETQMNQAVGALDAAVSGRNSAGSRQASVDVALAALDLELQYRPRAEIDEELLEAWARQLEIDREARDEGAIRSDRLTIRMIRDRLAR